MFDIEQNITSLQDVEAFTHYLYDDRELAFHPDESFEDYVRIGSDKHTFTKLEAELLNQRMEECFNVCKNEDVDIYEFMMQFSPIHALMLN